MLTYTKYKIVIISKTYNNVDKYKNTLKNQKYYKYVKFILNILYYKIYIYIFQNLKHIHKISEITN